MINTLWEQNYLPLVEFSPTKYVYISEASEALQLQVSQISGTPQTTPDHSHLSLALPLQKQLIDQEQILLAIGKMLAIQLASILEQFKADHREATSSIIAILEPYLNTHQELDTCIPPKFSREITINVSRGGKVRPEASLD